MSPRGHRRHSKIALTEHSNVSTAGSALKHVLFQLLVSLFYQGLVCMMIALRQLIPKSSLTVKDVAATFFIKATPLALYTERMICCRHI